jgi:hypothetical protein
MGLPAHYAQFLAALEAATAGGSEERGEENNGENVVQRVGGRPATRFDDWAVENRAVWE